MSAAAAGNQLQERAALISGGSRGIGLAIARQLAARGANIAIVAKTATPIPNFQERFTRQRMSCAAGAEVLPIVGDIRDSETVERAVDHVTRHFNGLDICINNASAIDLRDVGALPPKRFDLMQAVNVRGTYLMTHACLPHLRRSDHAHVLTLSPPLNPDPVWFAPAGYANSKYGMTIVTPGVAQTERANNVAANCLWPLTAIATAAAANLLGGDEALTHSRKPEIVADAAAAVINRDPSTYTGNAAIVEDVLAEAGVTDLDEYSYRPGQTAFAPDFFVDPKMLGAAGLGGEALELLKQRGAS